MCNMGANLMAEYNPDALDESATKAEVSGQMTAEITEIQQDVAHNIFGDNVQSDPDKEMLVVTAETEISGEMQEVESVFSLPESDQSWLNPLFKLARFRAKYGEVPREGMQVEITTNENGFLDVDIPARVDVGSQD